ncbi:metallophosphoesterase [Pelosinus sp. sgz500959]|uniref:metallophosphoesterase n=1 Tax=Pelosinus sp. sgz500959 TaxID=3242472 RepID=UPI003673234E
MDMENKKFSRRKFIKIAGGITAGVASLYTFLPGMRERPKQAVDSAKAIVGHYLSIGGIDALSVRQIITEDSSNSRTIMWQSELAEKDAVVEYRRKGKEDIKSSLATDEAFTDDKRMTYIHTTVLKDLTAGAQYEYRVGYDDKRSDWHDLNTDDGGDFKALIFPDSQSNDYSDWKKLAQFARKNNPDAAFFVNMGDLVDNGEDHTQWRAWFDSMRGIIDTIPIAPVLGNHETYNQDWKVRMPEAYLHLFSLPANGNAERRNQFYSFDYGSVHFIVLNTQFDEMEQFQPGLLETEKEWFVNDIAQTRKKWRIVLMHKDVLTYEIRNRSDRQAGISDIGKNWMPLFDKYGIDVVLTAHLHTYRRRDRLYNFQSDTRGPLYIVTGVAGNVRYPNLWVNHPFDKAVAPQPETDNYMTLEVGANTLKLASFLPSGERIDQVEITKN